MDDYKSRIVKENRYEYGQLLNSHDLGARQRAHQMRRIPCYCFLSHVSGNKHMLLACITHPICRAAQPVASAHIASILQAWEEERRSYEYPQRRRLSEQREQQRNAYKKAAHAARQRLASAINIDTATEYDEQDG